MPISVASCASRQQRPVSCQPKRKQFPGNQDVCFCSPHLDDGEGQHHADADLVRESHTAPHGNKWIAGLAGAEVGRRRTSPPASLLASGRRTSSHGCFESCRELFLWRARWGKRVVAVQHTRGQRFRSETGGGRARGDACGGGVRLRGACNCGAAHRRNLDDVANTACCAFCSLRFIYLKRDSATEARPGEKYMPLARLTIDQFAIQCTDLGLGND